MGVVRYNSSILGCVPDPYTINCGHVRIEPELNTNQDNYIVSAFMPLITLVLLWSPPIVS